MRVKRGIDEAGILVAIGRRIAGVCKTPFETVMPFKA
jgi:hypothetical protein